jgi:hypothetical protein
MFSSAIHPPPKHDKYQVYYDDNKRPMGNITHQTMNIENFVFLLYSYVLYLKA